MSAGAFRFDRFVLDPEDRRLTRDGATVELNSRYLDALMLLVRERGRLVTKDRFMDEVWRGVPVTDEALTQCIRTLRRVLGDDATRPRFIQTAPKHGYRFIALVSQGGAATEVAPAASEAATEAGPTSSPWWREGLAGTLGGGLAGALGGVFYGLVAASRAADGGMGAVSVLLVMVALCAAVALAGGAGVAFGVAAARRFLGNGAKWSMLGGMVGGMSVGGLVKLVGLDAFNLLLGEAPAEITGAPEGMVLGGLIGLAAWLSLRARSLRTALSVAGLTGAGAGAIIALAGGRLMAGSLEVLTGRFEQSRLQLAQIGAMFGESGFGPITLTALTALEGGLFASCMVGAMMLARRRPGIAGVDTR